jgi:type IV secretory pathway TrbD component
VFSAGISAQPMITVPVATPLSVASIRTIPVLGHIGQKTTPPMLTGDDPVSDWIIGILTGVVLLGLYTWIFVDVAATIAVKRVEDAVNAWKDEVDDLDDMMER